MNLTSTAIRASKPNEKTQRLFDGRGLYLEISPKGGRWWRFKYYFEGRERRCSLGVYPDVSLQQARERREEARKMVADGIDPIQHRKAQKAAKQDRLAHSFEVIAREWLDKYSPTWSPEHSKRNYQNMEKDIFPWVGSVPISNLTPGKLLEALQRTEKRGALETAHRLLSNCTRVFRYAIATGRAKDNPCDQLKGALPPVKGGHFAAVTEPKKVAEILKAIDCYEGTLTVRCALQLAPLVFVRPGELRRAEWKDIDFDSEEWRYLVIKTQTPHIVPLSRQAIQILHEVRPLTGEGRYVFPSARTNLRPMSDNALLAAMRRMGIAKDEMSTHGFRAMARTILDEVLGVRPDYIEHQLAHAVRDPNGRAYNRTAHLEERRKMMQKWADYLDKLKRMQNARAV